MNRLPVPPAILVLLVLSLDPAAGQTAIQPPLTDLGQSSTSGWEPFNGAKFEAITENGKPVVRSIPSAGAGDRGAFIAGLDFANGVIEIDLKGSSQPAGSFLGLVFHGESGTTYDAVYFRPFNFHQSDPTRRDHAVQYMSHPDWDWQRLRKEKPGVYEARAKPEPGGDEWFHARVEVRDFQIRVFINQAEEPCLEVTKLSKSTRGKVGLWFNGVASFANLIVDPQ